MHKIEENNENESGQYLTKDEVAKLLRCSTMTVSRLIKKGLPVLKIGRLVRISSADLLSFLNDFNVTY